MSAAVVAVSGTGTGVGKTYVATALTLALASRGSVVAVKPYESGHGGPFGPDQRALAEASTIDVTELGLRVRCFPDAVAPPEAARRVGERVDLWSFLARFQAARARFSGMVVLELAGGIHSPFDDAHTNAAVLRALAPEHHLLVAPNRLGVLHDARATVRAARADGLIFDALVLSQTAATGADASCDSNARALETLVHSTPIVLEHGAVTAAAATLGAAWSAGAFRRR